MRTEAQFDELLSQGSHAKEELLAALQTLVLSIRDRAVETSLVLCPEPLDEPDESAKPEKAEYAPTQAELFFRTALETEQPVPKLSEATDDYIPVHPVHNGGEATRRATALLGKIIRWLNQNPLHSFRGTGVIHCPGADFEKELKAVALARKKLRGVLVEMYRAAKAAFGCLPSASQPSRSRATSCESVHCSKAPSSKTCTTATSSARTTWSLQRVASKPTSSRSASTPKRRNVAAAGSSSPRAASRERASRSEGARSRAARLARAAAG